ncbi:hypothetical protein SAMN05428995_10195 [Loktanella sp. DSM 29012]|uniref:hypothetical protein n=1 Tax=Loktanella sp. DSM 29012 TaxID=1881056 RepID=UPI0008D05E2B|nr:hypothetical protein [Loktanella sp. DSM 29012]SEP56638.1 hypothetical protein SAMN05428995_10195 [Loktanella sp. DSM 29012]
MQRLTLTDAIGGLLLIVTMIARGIYEWGGGNAFLNVSMVSSVAALALFAAHIPWSRRVFLIIGIVLTMIALVVLPDGRRAITEAVMLVSFITGFFAALTTLRSAALTSAPIVRTGEFLASQPPGRRYLALTAGGGLFGLILMYGAIQLLGGLAAQSVTSEPNPERRRHRLRRMLVAIQRGFIATLPWSPLAFSMAISTQLIPGATWAGAVLPCAVSGVILVCIGWAMDSIFKPRISGPAATFDPPDGTWLRRLMPLLTLLLVIGAVTLGLHLGTGVRVVGVVMIVVPVIAVLWMGEQDVLNHHRHPVLHVAGRARDYAMTELPGNRSEIVLLAMAGFIGSLGAALLSPVIVSSGIDLSSVPAPVVLLVLFWTIPLAGQFGMNPILSVSLLAPLLPAPAEIGAAPAAFIVAITGGWALSGATSPYTASTLLIAQYGKVSASHVGLRWNGGYALTCGVVLSVWVLIALKLL